MKTFDHPAGVGQLPGVRLVADFAHGFGQQMLPFRVRLGGRMEEIEEHVPGRRLLTQEQLHRVRRTLPRRLQRQIAQPLGQGFAIPFGGDLDLPQLLGRDPRGDGFGAKAGLLLHACGGVSGRRSGRAGSAQVVIVLLET